MVENEDVEMGAPPKMDNHIEEKKEESQLQLPSREISHNADEFKDDWDPMNFMSKLRLDSLLKVEDDDDTDYTTDTKQTLLQPIPEDEGQGNSSAIVEVDSIKIKEQGNMEKVKDEEKDFTTEPNWDGEYEKQAANKQLVEKAGTIPDVKDCITQACTPPWEWSYWRWILLIAFLVSLAFVIMGSENDQPAYDYLFSIVFIIVSGLALWLSYDYYTNWRISVSIQGLWEITESLELETRRFTWYIDKLTHDRSRLCKLKDSLVNQREQFKNLNSRLHGQVKDFRESQKKLQENLLKGRHYCDRALAAIKEERKLVEQLVKEESKTAQQDARFMLGILFDHYAERNRVTKERYPVVLEAVKAELKNILDFTRVMKTKDTEEANMIVLPVWEDVAKGRDGSLKGHVFRRDFVRAMDEKFVEASLKKMYDMKLDELRGEREKIRAAASLLKPLMHDFVQRTMKRKQLYEKYKNKGKLTTQ
mmetsp:Transcript_21983/g.35378  ORF Transcript_21983/g.35378 Transcript_21983/m.35378 type:complete len:477 (-) Transcript_21983:203-1633(-)